MKDRINSSKLSIAGLVLILISIAVSSFSKTKAPLDTLGSLTQEDFFEAELTCTASIFVAFQDACNVTLASFTTLYFGDSYDDNFFQTIFNTTTV